MNFKKMMKQAQQMQEQMQEKLAEVKVEGTAGGGMVRVEMTGHRELVSVSIEKEAVNPDDVEMLEDLVLAAVSDAGRKVEDTVQQELGGMAGGLGIPGL